MISSLPNIISAFRGPAAFLFLSDSVQLRAIAIGIAMSSDWLDGYLARRYGSISRLGTILDPLMDKFFVCFVLGVFLIEGKLEIWEALTFLSRDIALLAFGGYLAFKGLWSKFEFRAILSGKLFTTLQFALLLALSYSIPIPAYAYSIFIILGLMAFRELRVASQNML